MGSSKSLDFGGFSKGGGSAQNNYSGASLKEETSLGGKKPVGGGELQYGQGPGKFALSVDADNNGYGRQSAYGKAKK